MSNKKYEPEFEIKVDDTPVTSDGDRCSCTEEGRDFKCLIHGG
jgi:uncharacterized Zn-binding protein involved in type VI secretion